MRTKFSQSEQPLAGSVTGKFLDPPEKSVSSNMMTGVWTVFEPPKSAALAQAALATMRQSKAKAFDCILQVDEQCRLAIRRKCAF